MQTVGEFLRGRNNPLRTIRPDQTVREALQSMAVYDIGVLLVMDGSKLVGVFCERDYARKVALLARSSSHTQVCEIMSGSVVSVPPTQTIQGCMEIMTYKRVRHLPVLDGQRVLGLISIGDILRELLSY